MAPDENYILKAESDFLVISIERKLFHLIPLLVDIFAILFFRRVHLIQHHINNIGVVRFREEREVKVYVMHKIHYIALLYQFLPSLGKRIVIVVQQGYKRFDYLIVLVIEFFQDDKRVFVIFNCS